MKKNLLILSLVILLSFVLGSFAFAQERPLEVEYPKLGGYELETTTTTIPEYVKYIYFSIIGLGGLLALVVLVNAGFGYFISAGNPEKIRGAKEGIAAALLGLLILFGSYLILIFINPELVMLRVTSLETFLPKLSPGVWLCEKEVGIVDVWYLAREYETANSARKKEISKELKSIFSDIDKYCYQVRSIKEIDKKVSYIYLVPWEEGKEFAEYGAILFEEPLWLGKIQVVFPWPGKAIPSPPSEEPRKISKVSSAIIFYLTPLDEDAKVTLYEFEQYNENAEWGGRFTYPPGGVWSSFYQSFNDIKEDLGGHSPLSIKKEGTVIAVLGKCKERDNATGECIAGEYMALPASDTRLDVYDEISEKVCGPLWKLWWRECDWVPAADTLILISGEIMWW